MQFETNMDSNFACYDRNWFAALAYGDPTTANTTPNQMTYNANNSTTVDATSQQLTDNIIAQRCSWPVRHDIDNNSGLVDSRRRPSPPVYPSPPLQGLPVSSMTHPSFQLAQQQQQLHHAQQSQQQYQVVSHHSAPQVTDWPLNQPQLVQQPHPTSQPRCSPQVQEQQQQQQHQQQFMAENAMMVRQYGPYDHDFHNSPIEHMALSQDLDGAVQQVDNSQLHSALTHNSDTHTLSWATMPNWQDFQQDLMLSQHVSNDALPAMAMNRTSLSSNSPTGTYLEVLSLPSSSSDHDRTTVDAYRDYDTFSQAQKAVFNPGQTLHLRSHSDSSHSDFNGVGSVGSDIFGSYEEVVYTPFSPYASPGSDVYSDIHSNRTAFTEDNIRDSPDNIGGPSVAMSVSPSVASVKSDSASSPTKRSHGPKRAAVVKVVVKSTVKRATSNGKKDGEKRVGRRKGPLLPEQRKQASEIRKLRACLRCKFLKKTCDTGETCAGCQPCHARLWQVPCTRIDIKDIGYLMKDWKADYERSNMEHGISVYNIKGFSSREEILWITHGYGFAIPISAREVFLMDGSCVDVEWSEQDEDRERIDFEVRTHRMSAGAEGISTKVLDEYLNKHVEGDFESFIDEFFQGTEFITEVLKTAHRFFMKEKLPIIKKALKLILAYNLTQHVTMVENRGDEHEMDGRVDDEESRYFSRTIAPLMINQQIKCALADMWRELQRDVLVELSALYSSSYSGNRLKNWPTIFMLASILLAVWEEMQFDAHFRLPDPATVDKFCSDMETTPVGVIVGLFHAISTKLPTFTEWDTARHGQLLLNNVAVCEAMTEMREHVFKHETYLKKRAQGVHFRENDFDSLSNKFLSKLVIRAS